MKIRKTTELVTSCMGTALCYLRRASGKDKNVGKKKKTKAAAV
jgi:hypothetical protein